MNHIQSHPDFVKFWLRVDNEEYNKLIQYNKVLNFVEEEFFNNNINSWHCHRILNHKPITKEDPEYYGCPFNILVEWTDGQWTWEAADICVW